MRTYGQLMFDRIVMNVIKVIVQVILIADGMLPESPLPYAAPAVALA